jgi:hypothetical protein
VTTALRISDRDIIDAARARGYHDAAVVVQNIPEHKHDFDHGRWFGMFVKFTAGDDWQLIGRRRTRQELLAMLDCTAECHDKGARVSK